MANRPGRIGREGENGVVRFLRANGFPHSERRRLRGVQDAGDLVTVPGLVVEVKAGNYAKEAGSGLVLSWLEETRREMVNAGCTAGLLVAHRKGYSADRAGMWWAWLVDWFLLEPASTRVAEAIGPVCPRLELWEAVRVLRAAGYGDALVWDDDHTGGRF